MRSGLILDDLGEMDHVSNFHSWKDAFESDPFGLFRPVKNLLYYYFRLRGLPSMLTWHWINLGTYLVSIFGVHCLVRRISGSVKWGLLATALWATSATQASTAIWMSCVNISLAMILTCGALIAYDRSWEEGARQSRFVMALFLTFTAQVSYETAVCIAPLCVLLDSFRGRSPFSRKAVLRYLALGIVTLAFLLIRKSCGAIHTTAGKNLGFDPAMPNWQVAVSAPWFVWSHFLMWVSPFGRVEFLSTYVWGVSASPLELALCWLFLVLLVAATGFFWRRLPLVAFGLGWFLLAGFPTSNLIPIRAGPVEDYYLVFPGVGLALAMTGLLQAGLARLAVQGNVGKLRTVLQPALLIFAMLVVLLSRGAGLLLFRQQANLWNDPTALYLVCAETRPAQFMAKALAARELMNEGHLESAKTLALEAENEGPWQFISPLLLGTIASREGDWRTTDEWFQIACERAGYREYIVHYCHLLKAKALVDHRNDFPKAREELLVVLQNPKARYHFDATLMLAGFYSAEGNIEKAVRTLDKSQAFHPDKTPIIKIVRADIQSGKAGSSQQIQKLSPMQR
jgi:hypothetical protein